MPQAKGWTRWAKEEKAKAKRSRKSEYETAFRRIGVKTTKHKLSSRRIQSLFIVLHATLPHLQTEAYRIVPMRIHSSGSVLAGFCLSTEHGNKSCSSQMSSSPPTTAMKLKPSCFLAVWDPSTLMEMSSICDPPIVAATVKARVARCDCPRQLNTLRLEAAKQFCGNATPTGANKSTWQQTQSSKCIQTFVSTCLHLVTLCFSRSKALHLCQDCLQLSKNQLYQVPRSAQQTRPAEHEWLLLRLDQCWQQEPPARMFMVWATQSPSYPASWKWKWPLNLEQPRPFGAHVARFCAIRLPSSVVERLLQFLRP